MKKTEVTQTTKDRVAATSQTAGFYWEVLGNNCDALPSPALLSLHDDRGNTCRKE